MTVTVTHLVTLAVAALGGGGLVAALTYRSNNRKTDAEAASISSAADVSHAERLIVIATGLVKPLQDRIAEQERDLALMRGEISELRGQIAHKEDQAARIAVLVDENRRLHDEVARLHTLLPPRSEEIPAP